VYLKSDLIREVASVEGDKLVYYLSVSETSTEATSLIRSDFRYTEIVN
jgi:hypothetical protein